MKLTLRSSKERGYFNHGWLETYHSFSFSDYQDPHHMSFRSLRVINEDFIEANEGFDTHGHKNMEIISYVLAGALTHQDSMGNGSVIRPGDVQYMSAGSGVLHSEYNHSKTDRTHLLQIWIIPSETGGKPRYDQKHFTSEQKLNKLCLVASGNPKDNVILIKQDATLYVGVLEKNKTLEYTFRDITRFGYIQLTKGKLQVNNTLLSPGDGLKIEEATDNLNLKGLDSQSEFLLFDLS